MPGTINFAYEYWTNPQYLTMKHKKSYDNYNNTDSFAEFIDEMILNFKASECFDIISDIDPKYTDHLTDEIPTESYNNFKEYCNKPADDRDIDPMLPMF